MTRQTIAFAMLILSTVAIAQPKRGWLGNKAKLARELGGPKQSDRRDAVDFIVSSPEIAKSAMPWLLEWAKCPASGDWRACPEGAQIAPHAVGFLLFDSMAQIFGRLRVRQAIPFLVQNISLGFSINRAGKSPITTDRPCIKALLQIGTDATPELLNALKKWPIRPGTDDQYHSDRLAILTTLAHLQDPRARRALESAASEPLWDGEIARYGLSLLAAKK